MYSVNTKLFWYWFGPHVNTYLNLFTLSRPERKYWLNELHTRIKAYCYNNVYMDLIENTGWHMVTLIVAARGSRHMLDDNNTVQKREGVGPGWQILAWNMPLPPGMNKEEAVSTTVSDLQKLDIKPCLVEGKEVAWIIELFISEEERNRGKVFQSVGDILKKIIGPEKAVMQNGCKANPIRGIAQAAQQGLIGMQAIPTPIQKAVADDHKLTDDARLKGCI